MARKSIVETYSKKPVSKRVDIIINNFSIFEDIIKSEEECLYVKIRREQEECLAEQRTDLGVRVQTSRISDSTGDTATANADVRSGIENGDWRLATKGTKNYGKYKNAIETLQLMRDDYTIVRGKLKGIRDDDYIFRIYLAKLNEIEEKENVKILHTVESGSRAWGFASPDSDYDVRFVYVRQRDDYLRLDEPRDVIEWQLDEVLDINGWDLKKALKQFARGNATLFEWSGSPIVYRTTPEWKKITEVSRQYFSEKTAVYHYYGTANSTYNDYLTGEMVRYKKYFYALRPLLAAMYIEENHAAPPVIFDELLKMDLPSDLRTAIDELLEIKKKTTEKEENPQLPAIRRFIETEIVRQKEIADSLVDDHNHDWTVLNDLFRIIVG